jgi:ABC-type antimicrobial peptide transport system permease subunit
VTGFGLSAVWRVPSRTLLGLVSVAVGTAALTPLLAITALFHGAVVGSVLGDAIAIQVRGSDLAAVAAIIAMGVFALADVLYLNVRERVHEYTVLRVVGWPERALARLVVTEGLGIGVLGAVCGAAVGLGVTVALVGQARLSVILAAVAAALASSCLAGLASLVPAALLRRMAPAPLLAAE